MKSYFEGYTCSNKMLVIKNESLNFIFYMVAVLKKCFAKISKYYDFYIAAYKRAQMGKVKSYVWCRRKHRKTCNLVCSSDRWVHFTTGTASWSASQSNLASLNPMSFIIPLWWWCHMKATFVLCLRHKRIFMLAWVHACTISWIQKMQTWKILCFMWHHHQRKCWWNEV